MPHLKYAMIAALLFLTGLDLRAQSLFVPQIPVQKQLMHLKPDRMARKLRAVYYDTLNARTKRRLDAELERDQVKHDHSKSPEDLNKASAKVELEAEGEATAQDDLNKADSSVISALDSLNKTAPNLTISGIGGVSEIQKPADAGGNFAVQATFRLGDYKKMGKRWADPLFLYMSFNTRAGNAADSLQLTKLYLFPNISKRDFVIGLYEQFRDLENGWSIEPITEFSLNRYKTVKDSITYSFTSESALIGCRFSKTQLFGPDAGFQAGFVLFPYYNIINVQPKNYASYNTVINGSSLPPTVHTLGLQAVLQLDKVQIFADMKYILNRHSDNFDPDDLRGFTYTIGTMVGVDALKFRLNGR